MSIILLYFKLFADYSANGMPRYYKEQTMFESVTKCHGSLNERPQELTIHHITVQNIPEIRKYLQQSVLLQRQTNKNNLKILVMISYEKNGF